jgi:hypothetical protein
VGGRRLWPSLLHEYSPKGAILRTLDGGSTGQRFQTPHALLIDDRRAEPELYIADRGNRRIVVLSMAGEFRRSFGDDVLSSPSGLAVDGDLLLVTELDGALAVFDLDSYRGTVGRSPAERSSLGRTHWTSVVYTTVQHTQKVCSTVRMESPPISQAVCWSVNGASAGESFDFSPCDGTATRPAYAEPHMPDHQSSDSMRESRRLVATAMIDS